MLHTHLQVSLERSIGTILGGVLGFVMYKTGAQFWNETTDGYFLSLVAAFMAFGSVVMGYYLALDYSAKLFAITFLLVTFGAAGGTGRVWS